MKPALPQLLLPTLALLPLPARAAELDALTVERAAEGAGYTADAVVEAVRQAQVAAQTSGRITERMVDAGAAVRQGTVLARIDDSLTRQAESASTAQAAAADAQLANAVAELERTRALFARQLVGKAALDRAEANERAARAQTDALRAGAALSRTERSFATVTAPFAGLIAAAHVQVGDLAVPGKPLFTLYDPAQMRVNAALPQRLLGQWQRQAPLRLSVRDGSGERLLEAVTVTVLPVTDTAAQTVTVRIDLPAHSAGLLPGLAAKVRFPLQGENRLMVPLSAVLQRGEMSAVYVLGPKGPSLRQLRLGAQDGDRVEVLAGLLDGERIARDPHAAAVERRNRVVKE